MTVAKSWLCALALLLGLSTLSLTASAGDKALAEALFQSARDLMKDGNYAEACPKFEQSHRADPSAGTLLNLAKCYELLGRTASAWAQYKEAAVLARNSGRTAQQAAAEEGAAQLEPGLSKLTIVGPSPAVPGLVVRRDGTDVGSGLGIALAVDPGSHTIEASAPGYETWSTEIEVGAEGDKQSVTIPPLVEAEGSTDTPTATPDTSEPSSETTRTTPEDTGGGSNLRTVGFIVGGVGVALAGTGLVFGALAQSQASDAENDATLCPNKECTPEGRAEIDGAKSKALISTIGVGVGAAAIVTGVVLILTSKSGAETARHRPGLRLTPVATEQGGFLSLDGIF